MTAPRIALIHATPLAIEPIVNAFRRLWPQARTTNVLEDSLAPDLAALDQAARPSSAASTVGTIRSSPTIW